jgi:putative peptidoglycan lipid II flippase
MPAIWFTGRGVSVDDGVRPTRQAWSTWPSAGIPTSPEAWRRPAAPVASMVRSASIVAIALVLSRALGVFRDVLIARQFGTGGETSAYYAAFRVPDLLFLVVMAGSFGSAFIPVFSGFLQRGEEEKAWRLSSAVITFAAVAVVLAAGAAFVAATPLVRYAIAPNLSPRFQALTVELMRLLLLSPVLLGLGIAAKGILEAQDRFLLPALAPLVYNLAIIFGAVALAPTMGIRGLAIGVVVGALGHVLIQVPGLVRSGLRFRPSLDRRTEGLGRVWRLLLPRVIGQAAFQINFIVVFAFASRLGDGYPAGLYFAWQLMMLPHGVLALSVSTVIFPTMARLYGEGRLDDLRTTLGRALRPVVFLTLPAAVGLFFYRTAIVQTIFQSGAFSRASTEIVAPPLALFAIGLLSYATVEILTRAFYAMQDTRTPVVAGVAIIAINVALCAALIGPYGLAGLALSLSASTTVEAIILLAVLRGRLGGVGRRDLVWLLRAVGATGAMALIAWGIGPRLTAATAPGAAPRVVQLVFFGYALAVTALAYLVAAHLLRLPELTQVTTRLAGRLPRRRLRLPGRRRRSSWPS